jgi:hypothetical protein
MRVASVLGFVVLGAATALPQTIQTFTASTDHAGDVRIDILRWSTDAERDQLFNAWTQPGAPGRGGRGRAGRGGAAEDEPVAGNDAAPGGGRAGRGGRGGAPAETTPATPEASLAAALNNAPIVGHLWSSSEVAGYILHFAAKIAEPDGGQRIILITERRLGAWTDAWKVAGGPSNYEFSLIELRLTSKGQGEGKSSLTGKVIPEPEAKMLVLDGYAALPVTLKNVKARN